MKTNIVNEVHSIVMREALYDRLVEIMLGTLEQMKDVAFREEYQSTAIGAISAWQTHQKLIKEMRND